MPWRSYIAPADDPNGNAGKLIWTDDQGHYQVGGTNPDPNVNTPTTATVSAGTDTSTAAGTGVDPRAILAAYQLADEAAQRAYLNAQLELQKQNAQHTWTYQDEQMALAKASDAWHQAIAQQGADVQTAIVTGSYQGAPTLAAQEASGYMTTPGLSAGVGQRLLDAANNLRNDPNYQAVAAAAASGDANAIARKKQMEMGSVATATGLSIDQATKLSSDLTARYQATGQIPSAADIDRLIQNDPSYQTPTLARQQMENQTGVSLLNLASQLRGPDNAFAYAKTLSQVPQSMRDQLNAMMARSGIKYQGSGLGTVAAQLGSGNINATSGGTSATSSGQAQQSTTGANPNSSLPGDSQAAAGAGSSATPTQHLYQMSPTDWNNTNEYVKRMMMAGLEAQGNDKDAETAAYQMALPKYTGPTSGRIAA